MLEVGDKLGELGESSCRCEADKDWGNDVIDKEAIEGFTEKGVDVAVVLGDAVHEEVEAFNKVSDLCVVRYSYTGDMWSAYVRLRSSGGSSATMAKSRVRAHCTSWSRLGKELLQGLLHLESSLYSFRESQTSFNATSRPSASLTRIGMMSSR